MIGSGRRPCPKCYKRMIYDGKVFRCPKCGHEEEVASEAGKKRKTKVKNKEGGDKNKSDVTQ